MLEAPAEGGGGATGIFITRNDPQETILKSPLATSLFKMDDVKAVFFGADFVTVTKFATGKWQYMRPEIFSILMVNVSFRFVSFFVFVGRTTLGLCAWLVVCKVVVLLLVSVSFFFSCSCIGIRFPSCFG